jgi:hypothetical protein
MTGGSNLCRTESGSKPKCGSTTSASTGTHALPDVVDYGPSLGTNSFLPGEDPTQEVLAYFLFYHYFPVDHYKRVCRMGVLRMVNWNGKGINRE